jgi:endoglucanase
MGRSSLARAAIAKAYTGPDTGVQYCGINLSGMEFAGGVLPGTFGVDYFLPGNQSVTFWAARGVNIVRFPFKWERLQPTLYGDLDATNVGRLQTMVSRCAAFGIKVILDCHNYGKYYSVTSDCNAATLSDFWGKLAAVFASSQNVVFGLMNEPAENDYTVWAGVCNACISAIRSAGATSQLILVPPNSGSTVGNFVSEGTTNKRGYLMPALISDPYNNVAYELHQYFDDGFSGTSAQVRGANIFRNFISAATVIARKAGIKLFFGEGGAGSSTQLALDCMKRGLAHMNNNSDVWIGWTVWGAGNYWSGSYILLLQGSNYADTQQSLAQRPYFLRGSKRDGSTVVSAGVLSMSDQSVVFGTVNGKTAMTGGYSYSAYSVNPGYSANGDYLSPVFRSAPCMLEGVVSIPSGWAPGATRYFFGNTFRLGIDSSGRPLALYGSVTIVAASNIKDGLEHHIRAYYSRTVGVRLYVDGVLVASSATTGDAAGLGDSGSWGVGTSGSTAGNAITANGGALYWCAAWLKDDDAGAFVAPTSPPTGGERDLYAVWPLGSGSTTAYGIGA